MRPLSLFRGINISYMKKFFFKTALHNILKRDIYNIYFITVFIISSDTLLILII